ncbi:hypothetical protein Tco_0296598 [Tanacetum coccineum]
MVTEGTTLDVSSVTEGTTLEVCLVTEGATLEACLVTKGEALEACLVTKGIKMDDNLDAKESTNDSITSSKQLDESSNSGNDEDVGKILVDTVASDIENANIRPPYDSDTVSEVHHDTFENVFSNEIHSHEQPDSISDTYVVNENNSDIISNIPNMDPNRDKEEHDYVDYEQQHALFSSLINNLRCDVEKCNKVNREAQQAMLKFEKETVLKQNPPRENVFINLSFEDNVKRIARNQLSKEFKPLVKDVNLQLNCIENGFVKEMKEDLKYVTSLEDEFDETCRGSFIMRPLRMAFRRVVGILKDYLQCPILRIGVAFDLLRDALSAIFGLSELKGMGCQDALGYILDCTLKDFGASILGEYVIVNFCNIQTMDNSKMPCAIDLEVDTAARLPPAQDRHYVAYSDGHESGVAQRRSPVHMRTYRYRVAPRAVMTQSFPRATINMPEGSRKSEHVDARSLMRTCQICRGRAHYFTVTGLCSRDLIPGGKIGGAMANYFPIHYRCHHPHPFSTLLVHQTPDAPPHNASIKLPTLHSHHYHYMPLKSGERFVRADPRLPNHRMGLDYGCYHWLDRQIRRDPERYVGYGITDSWDEIVETLQGAPVSTDTELGAHMREFESMVRRDTDEIYTRLDDEQGQRQLLAGRVNMLFRDRRTHAHTRQLMETEAGMSREAWGRAMDASDLAHGGVISLRTTVHAQMSEITELQSADRRRQRAMSDLLETDRRRREEMRELRAADRTRQQQIIQTLTAVQTLQRETIPLQGLVTTLQGQVTALQGQVMTLQGQVTILQGQQGLAGGPAQPELPEDTGSSS